MTNGRINLGKQSGGVLGLLFPDGATNTEVTLPESGTLATTNDINTSAILLKTIATGTATFTSTTNSINLTGIGIGVEVGDVIQISGADDTKNNSEFTVEVITDANNIIVNQAHANKSTTKNLAARVNDTGVTVKLLAKWYNASDGLGQDWVILTGSRLINTIYNNTSGRSIKIAINFSTGTSGEIEVNGVFAGIGASTLTQATGGLTTIAPNGATYKYTGGASIRRWSELR